MEDEELALRRVTDRIETRERMEHMSEIGRDIFAGTNLLTNEGEIGEVECAKAREYLLEALPVTVDNYRLHAHLLTAAEMGRRLAQALIDQNADAYADVHPDEQYVIGLLHDIGKYAVGFKYGREEFATQILLKKIGIRSSITDNLPLEGIEFHRANTSEKETALKRDLFLDEHFTPRGIATMADIYGKRVSEGWSIQPFLGADGVLQYHYDSKRKLVGQNTTSMYPSGRILDDHLIILSGTVYEELDEYFKRVGIDPEDIQKALMQEEADAPISTVIFDTGNVLVHYPHAKIVDNMAEAFGVDRELVEDVFSEFFDPVQIGKIDLKTSFSNLAQRLHVDLPPNWQTLLTEDWDGSIDPKMQAVIDALRSSGIRLAVHTDTIPEHIEKITREGGYGGIAQVISSPMIGVTKNGLSTDPFAAFGCVTVLLGGNPHTLLFTDDLEKFVRRAQELGMHAVQFSTAEKLQVDLKELGI